MFNLIFIKGSFVKGIEKYEETPSKKEMLITLVYRYIYLKALIYHIIVFYVQSSGL